jgi:hypothetical protein
MHNKNEGELKIFISSFAHFSHALARKYLEPVIENKLIYYSIKNTL